MHRETNRTVIAASTRVMLAASLGLAMVTALAGPAAADPTLCSAQGRDVGCANDHYVSIDDRERDGHNARIVWWAEDGSRHKLEDSWWNPGISVRRPNKNVDRFKVCEVIDNVPNPCTPVKQLD